CGRPSAMPTSSNHCRSSGSQRSAAAVAACSHAHGSSISSRASRAARAPAARLKRSAPPRRHAFGDGGAGQAGGGFPRTCAAPCVVRRSRRHDNWRGAFPGRGRVARRIMETMPRNPFQPASSLFAEPEALKPLAERMRPRTLDEIVGQRRLVAPDRALRRALEAGRLHSMVLWGPPGCGKTTLALLVAQYADADFKAISAVLSGLPEVRKALAEAEANFAQGRRTVLFVDEVHRFNKTQQDAFLPHIERGVILFVGATTENPSFELNSALLSRCRVHVLEAVSTDDIVAALKRALADTERGLGAQRLDVDDASL